MFVFKERGNVPLDSLVLALADFRDKHNSARIRIDYVNESTRRLFLDNIFVATITLTNHMGLIKCKLKLNSESLLVVRSFVETIDLYTDPVNVPVYSNEKWLVGGREISAFLRTSAICFKLRLAMCNSTDY